MIQSFYLRLLDEVNQNNILDLNRVYAIGYSNGGMLSHFLACNTENVFAAIGDVAGTMLSDAYNLRIYWKHLYHSLKIHGTNDGVVPYDAEASFDNNVHDQFKTVNQVIDLLEKEIINRMIICWK